MEILDLYTVSAKPAQEVHEKLGSSNDLFHALLNCSLELLCLETFLSQVVHDHS